MVDIVEEALDIEKEYPYFESCRVCRLDVMYEGESRV
jgi:hypothetical protein